MLWGWPYQDGKICDVWYPIKQKYPHIKGMKDTASATLRTKPLLSLITTLTVKNYKICLTIRAVYIDGVVTREITQIPKLSERACVNCLYSAAIPVWRHLHELCTVSRIWLVTPVTPDNAIRAIVVWKSNVTLYASKLICTHSWGNWEGLRMWT